MSASSDDLLRISVLGPLRAWIGERELNLGPGRQRALFAALTANANRMVSRDELIEAVWGASAPATATGSVYTYISGLRRSLDPDRAGRGAGELLVSGSSGYLLRLSPGALDSDRFAVLCTRAAELHGAGDLAGAAARLDEALALWHGEAYGGLSGHLLEVERAHLADRRLAAVERRARIVMELGDDGLVAELAGLARDHPLHEPLHELLMLALHRAGRHAEALEVFRAARRTLVAELGVEPGPALRDLHRRVLAGSVEPADGFGPRPVDPIVPTPVARAIRDGLAGRTLVGRDAELARLRGLTRDVAGGTGAAVWIEGEPGIGKTELLTAAFAAVGDDGCQLAWGVADELDRHVPLQVITRALGIEPDSADPRRAALAAELDGGDQQEAGTAPAADRVLAYVRATCAVAPLVLVVDDLQWADDASVLLWDRLIAATPRMPLLLVAAARPEPNGRALARLRRGVRSRQGHALMLRALPPRDIEELVAALVGARIGPHLRGIVPRSGGNPLCARELATALLRRGVVRISDGRAEIPAAVPVEAPRSLLAVVRATLDFLTGDTQEVLRLAALLGTEFAVDDVVAVTGRSPFDLMVNLEEALAANVLVDSGSDLAFRHPFLRQALHESVPAAERSTLHRHTAEALARGGSPVTRVAEQLAAETPVIDAWVVRWLVEHHAEVVKRTPLIAAQLLRQALATDLPAPRQRETLLVALVKLEFRQDRYPMDEALEALGSATDPADRAEMRQVLSAMRFRRGDAAGAIGLLTGAVDDRAVPELWRTRHRVLLANFRRGDLSDLDRADRAARRVHDEAVAADQPYEAAFALQTTWLTNSIRRDHERALEYVDRALDIMHDHPTFAGMYFDLLDNRMFTLQNLDRLEEAERTLREAALFAIRHRLPASLQVASAVQYHWLGRWDDATAEVSAVTDDAPGLTFLGMREPGAVTMLLHGVAALIAGHRDDADLAAAHLDAADAVPASDAERESCDFLLVARALGAEQRGRPAEALSILAPLLTPEYAPMMLRHQWLPDAIRVACEIGREDVARRAAKICADEAAKEVRPARAWAAAARCRALLSGDPEPALEAVAHYRAVGRVPELAAACEDAAVLLAARRRPQEAALCGGEAAEVYTVLGARWDLRRLRRRLAEFGIEGVRVAAHTSVRSG
ncbi:BTAD domain-containing putative transcriptional regulator [Amorphoplanes digitatis]|uniref:DNA-binding SARP family transcriptional activator n=1 Tax=Actinoplanes digitatis TaxID=1868 RepID=A0A7W7I5I5_9ACTN|nr:BTAD domain-containing putative transcriptional regulator [Actinoplanes digitatis]MBB4766830.1 DNA-binding SARP family transcriptional activator [Actinoplanes digitatis]GID96430.1 SARP family transcriptional regulator [Actinoplanes digitatis]